MCKLIKCKTCNGQVSTSAQSCPHCGEPDFSKWHLEREKGNCFKCKGTGRVVRRPYSTAALERDLKSDFGFEDCNLCKGTGKGEWDNKIYDD